MDWRTGRSTLFKINPTQAETQSSLMPLPAQGFVVLCRGPREPPWALGGGYPGSCFCPWNWDKAGQLLPWPPSELPLLRAGGCCSVLRSHLLPRPSAGLLCSYTHLVNTVTQAFSKTCLGPFQLMQGPYRQATWKYRLPIPPRHQKKLNQVLVVFIICQRLKECILPFFQRVILKSNRDMWPTQPKI